MTLAETLNEKACTCGLEEGRTWFADSNGEEAGKVGEYRLLHNNNGVEVGDADGGWSVTATKGESREVHWARFDTSDYSWHED